MASSQCTKLMSQAFAVLPPYKRRAQETVSRNHVPAVFGEPAIINGYRLPNKPLTYYFESLFHIHNETFNVWSHLIGCFMIVYKLYVYGQEFDIHKDPVLTTLIVFGVASFIEFMASSLAHLLHSKSPYVHFVILLFDYIGASFTGFAGCIFGFYGVSDPKVYGSVEWFYIPVVTVFTYANFLNMSAAKLWYGHCPHNMIRKYMNIAGLACMLVLSNMAFLPRVLDCFQDSECSMTSVSHLLLVNVLYILSALTFAAHQPEKTWPGKFDILGHGHQIFHVVTLALVWFQFDAIYTYHERGLTTHSKPKNSVLLLCIIGVFAADCLTLVYFTRVIPQELEKDIKIKKEE